MAKITEDYCPKDIYRLLLEKGFDGEIHTTYDEEGYTQAAITLQMAMKWLREVHNIFISIVFCTYHSLKVTWIPDITTFDSVFPESAIEYDSYEEATEAAIKYCLEKLI